MTFGAIGSVLWGWIKSLPNWVWYVFLIIAAGYVIDKRGEARGRKKAEDKRDKQDVEEMGRVNDAREHANQENQNAADRADEAVRTMPRHLPDELRDEAPDIADIVLGPRRDGT